jgi:hypothetical protein
VTPSGRVVVGATVVGARVVVVVVDCVGGGSVAPVGIEVTGLDVVVALVGGGVVSGAWSAGTVPGPEQAAITPTRARHANRPALRAGPPERVLRIPPQ